MNKQSTQDVLQNTTSNTKAEVQQPEIKIDTGKPFTVATPEGEISDMGRFEVSAYLKDCGLPAVPADFIWQWSTNRGTLPKRITSYCYKEHQVKLTPVHISELGNLAKRHTSQSKVYTLDFTNKINWYAGAFGDEGSCFWSDRSKALDMIQENGYSVRGFKPYPHNNKLEPRQGFNYPDLRGYSRAWLAPISNSSLIVFNGYGETSLLFARLMSVKYSCSYKRVRLTNNGDETGYLYINGDGYLVGQWSAISSVERYDLGWEEPPSDNVCCYDCDGEIDTDNDDCHEIGGQYYCDNCVAYCSRCEAYFPERRVRYFEPDSDYLCAGCREIRQEQIDELSEAEAI